MPLHDGSAAEFIARGGRIPAPLHSLKNGAEVRETWKRD